MDTVGSLVDKMQTTCLKMFNEQEKLYEIRRGTFEDFKSKYQTDAGILELYNYFIKVSDLNIQRNNYMDEIDQKIIDMIKVAMSGVDIENTGFIQKKWKTL
jgi:hypothetical protein